MKIRVTKTIALALLAVLILAGVSIYYFTQRLPPINQNIPPNHTPTPTQPSATPSQKSTITPTPTPQTTVPPSQTQATSGNNGQLQLTLSVEKNQYNLGEPVNVQLTISNVSNQTLNFTHTGLDFDFQVLNDSNNLVYQWSNFKAIAQFVTIEPIFPGENVTESLSWSQTCNFNPAIQGDPVSSGTYSMVGLSSRIYNLQTGPVQIVIIAG